MWGYPMPSVTFLCRWHEIRLTLIQARAYPAGEGLGDFGCSRSTLGARHGIAAIVSDALLMARLPAFHLN